MRSEEKHPPSLISVVTVIVPAWNEEDRLPACLHSIGAQRPGVEIILVDGGSTDRTVEIAREFGARIVLSPVRQRATQLNLAAQQAGGEVMLFLHADTLLPDGWLEHVRATLDTNSEIQGGAFRRRFDHPSRWLAWTSALADWRGRIWGCFLGDQAMFIRSAAFWSLGGFRPMERCEDLDLSLRLARAGRTRLIRRQVLSSGRRFLARGPFRQTWADFATAWRFIRQRPADDDVAMKAAVAAPQASAVKRPIPAPNH